MLISESYFLLMLDDSKGKNRIKDYFGRKECFAAAWIMDLIFRRKLSVVGKKLEVIDSTSTGDEDLDEILGILKDSKKMRKLRTWVFLFSSNYLINLYDLIFKRLENQGILKYEKKPILRVFVNLRYFFLQPEVKQPLLEQIYKVIIDNLGPDIRLLCLLNLLKISRLISVHVPKEYRKLAKYRIDDLVHYGKYEPKHLEMILSIEKAIKKAMEKNAWM